MSKTLTALITTTEKNKIYLEKLICSLSNQTYLPKKAIIIYDRDLRPVKETFENCTLAVSWMDNKESDSLTLLMNKAIKFIEEDAVLLLNDDVILERNFIEELIKNMEVDEQIGMVCGKILRMDKITIDTTGQLLGSNRAPIERGYGTKDKGQYDLPDFVFSCCGAAVLYRRKMLEDCQLSPAEYFDNSFHMFYEDLDISWRAQNFGWKAFYTPKAVAYHSRGATAKEKEPPLKLFRPYNFVWLRSELKSDLIKNRYMTIIKNDSFAGFLLNIHHVLLYELKIFLYCLVFDPVVIINTVKNIPVILAAFKKRTVLFERSRQDR